MGYSHYHETCANTHLVSGEMYYAVAFLYQNGMGSLVRNVEYCLTSVPDHLNKQTSSRLGPLLSSPKVFPIDVMLKD